MLILYHIFYVKTFKEISAKYILLTGIINLNLPAYTFEVNWFHSVS